MSTVNFGSEAKTLAAGENDRNRANHGIAWITTVASGKLADGRSESNGRSKKENWIMDSSCQRNCLPLLYQFQFKPVRRPMFSLLENRLFFHPKMDAWLEIAPVLVPTLVTGKCSG
jgi:hypothetical protein